MNLTNTEREAVRGLDPAVVQELARQTGMSAEQAAEELKRLGAALLDAEMDAGGPIHLTGRAARRARERAERKHGRR